MTVKEFKELIDKAEKKGEINENSEIFVLDDDQLVMSKPALFTDFNRNLILKCSYQSEVLVNECKLFNSEDVLTPFNFEKSKDLLNKLCYFGSSKTELIANIVKDNKMLLSQKFDGGIDCYCTENNEWYSFCIPCYKVKAKEIE